MFVNVSVSEDKKKLSDDLRRMTVEVEQAKGKSFTFIKET